MKENKIRQSIEQILDNSPVGVMATVRYEKPHARYMTFFRDGLTLYTATNKRTDKVQEIEAVPHTHILLGYEGEGFGDEYVEYEGVVKINHSEQLKKKLWNEQMKSWFDGPNDPNYIVLEIIPIYIQLMNKNGVESQVLTVSS